MSIKGYSEAQICLNGHVVSPVLNLQRDIGRKFCSLCGVATITACPECKQPIRGTADWESEHNYRRPAFCPECSAAYPWTGGATAAAKEYADAVQLQLDQSELADIIENLVRDSPRTAVVAARFSAAIKKAGPAVSEGMRHILVEVITEGAKKMIWPA